MSYMFQPITERVQKIREKYRNTQPELDLNRFKIVTEFYESHDELTGILKRAYNFKNLCEKLPLFVDEDELIVGSMVTKFRAAAMYPENSIDWLIRDLKDRSLMTRKQDPYICSEETRQYVLDHGDFWMTHSMLNRFNPIFLRPTGICWPTTAAVRWQARARAPSLWATSAPTTTKR